MSGNSMQQRAEQRLSEIETLTLALSDMCALDYTVKKMMHRQKGMNKEEFKTKLIRARQSRQATDEEVDFLFSVLDTHKDNQLSAEDFSNVRQDFPNN
jgi:hypothetical protein